MHKRTRRLFESIVPTEAGCWPWPRLLPSGYGLIYRNGRGSPVVECLTLDHLCRNRACVNPAHLEPVTNHENILRGSVPSANREFCRNGIHVLAVVGIYVDSEGTERCRECRLESKRRYQQRKAA